MIPSYRADFNKNFSEETYQKMMEDVSSRYNMAPAFKVAETPVFVPTSLKVQLTEACEQITDVIARPDFKELSRGAMIEGNDVPNETDHTAFLQMDFGICYDENGNLTPRLIEAQGFPSLYYFQNLVANCYREHYGISDDFHHLFGGITEAQYFEKLREIIVGDSHPENVVLLEVEPSKQVTRIDFKIAAKELGIKVLCVSEVKKSGRELYYINKEGRKIGIERIYNRVIFDELVQRDDLKREYHFTDDVDVQWAGHPNWFFRISKHTLPLLDSPYVPKSVFLDQIDTLPENLDQYVLKPLYSFAGSGVIINLNHYDLERIQDKHNYILQKKVEYAPVVETKDIAAKCEIRMLMLWERGEARPVIVNNLCRLSKGAMIGVRYNKDKTWVGGSVGFFNR